MKSRTDHRTDRTVPKAVSARSWWPRWQRFWVWFPCCPMPCSVPWRQLSWSGLLCSTLITLLFIPILYALFFKIKNNWFISLTFKTENKWKDNDTPSAVCCGILPPRMGTGNTESERVPRNGIKIQQGNGGFRRTDGKCPLYCQRVTKGTSSPTSPSAEQDFTVMPTVDYSIAGGNLPSFCRWNRTVQSGTTRRKRTLLPSINWTIKMGWVYMAVCKSTALYMGGKIRTPTKCPLEQEISTKWMKMTATGVIQKTDGSIRSGSKQRRWKQ